MDERYVFSEFRQIEEEIGSVETGRDKGVFPLNLRNAAIMKYGSGLWSPLWV